ncbi:MAG: 5-formyltetrahydrofolate cyclo-ligase [Verrucomicrobiales bacterium]
MDKRARRRDCFARVKALSAEEKAFRSRSIVEYLEVDETFRRARCVFAYVALPSEPDLQELFAGHPDKRWAYSLVSRGDILKFHEVSLPDQFLAGSFGFQEPDSTRCHEVPPEEADLILVPGVGFDPASGVRLGRGRGHYDRYLNGALKRKSDLETVGVCFSDQLSELLPEPHDVPMNRIVSERGWER